MSGVKIRIEQDANLEQQTSEGSFVFIGSGVQYFKIWIVNLLLSVLTLGIFSAWAKTRTKRYFYRNTQFDGHGFDYHASPFSILLFRILLIVVAIVLVFVGASNWYMQFLVPVFVLLVSPGLIWFWMKFEAEMSSFRGVRFGFIGACSAAYVNILALPLAFMFCGVMVSVLFAFLQGSVHAREFTLLNSVQPAIVGICLGMFFVIPYLHYKLSSYRINSHRFGSDRFKARLETRFYYSVFFKTWILIALMVQSAVVVSMLFSVSTDWKSAVMKLVAPPNSTYVLVILGVVVFFLLLWLRAFYLVRCRNHVLNRLQLQSVASFRSGEKTSRAFYLTLGNLLIFLFSLGFAWPWIRVRVARYQVETLNLNLFGNLDQYIAELESRSVVPVEEVFDLELKI